MPPNTRLELMSRPGRLKGLADSLADQFVSRNHDRGGWAMGVLYRACMRSGRGELEIDLLSRTSRPHSRASQRSAQEYASKLRVYGSVFGVPSDSVRAARVVVRFNEESRAHRWTHRVTGGDPFRVAVTLEDDQGRHAQSVKAGWCWPDSWYLGVRLFFWRRTQRHLKRAWS